MKRIFALALGILTAIGGFVDIGDLVTNAVVGAKFGLGLAWVVLIGVAGICLYADMAGRVAAVSGRATFETYCAQCHGPTLRQLPSALLAGPEFVAKWGDKTAADLLAQVRATMPPDRPGALAEAEYLGVIAYVLQSNGGKPSARLLTAATPARLGAGLNPVIGTPMPAP